MGHWIPYRLEQTKFEYDTTWAMYYGDDIYYLCYSDGQLYYAYWSARFNNSPDYVKWGEELILPI